MLLLQIQSLREGGGGQGRTMTQGPMEFRGPMSSKEGPSKWHWEVKGPLKSHITILFLLEITWFRAEKPLKFRRRPFFLVITSFFGPNSSIFSVYFGLYKTTIPSHLSWPRAHVRLSAPLYKAHCFQLAAIINTFFPTPCYRRYLLPLLALPVCLTKI